MPADFMNPAYDPLLVVASGLIAFFAAFVALELANRVRAQTGRAAAAWIAGGAVVMGSGIWATHFAGMLAMTLPIEIGYAARDTFISWAAAIGVSALALSIAARERLDARTLVSGALVMGGGICAMHYSGMAALSLAPGILWNPWLVATSVLIAVVAAAASLLIFFGMRRLHGRRALAAQLAAAAVMGLAICGMHYVGMAAAGFPAQAVCLSADGLRGDSLAMTISLATCVLLSSALLTMHLDARLNAQARGLNASLQASNEQLAYANAELRRLAFSDPLTGIANRALFEDRLQHALERVDRVSRAAAGSSAAPRLKLALLFIDLDGFKPVNDGYGHAAGDAVLRQVAGRLRGLCRAADTLARVGGDEFVLLLEDLPAGSESQAEAEAAASAQRVVRALSQPFEWPGRTVSLSASIGVAVYPDHGERDRLMASADAAMYAAKNSGGAGYAVFRPHMSQGVVETVELQEALRVAIAQGALQLHYQPKVDRRSGRVHSVEALLRWTHPQRGPISPAVFVPIAERFGLIVPLGNWVLDEACRQIAAWRAQGRDMRVAINLSAHQLRHGDLVQCLNASLQRHGVSPRSLICEITESVAMEDMLTSQHAMQELTAMGVELSIDDFGTGYSSLGSLRQLRAHELKIDRAFVHDLASDPVARALVRAVVHLAQALKLRVVAEGVETVQQRDVLIALECDELQGYLFARPVPADALGWNTAGQLLIAHALPPRYSFTEPVSPDT